MEASDWQAMAKHSKLCFSDFGFAIWITQSADSWHNSSVLLPLRSYGQGGTKMVVLILVKITVQRRPSLTESHKSGPAEE